MSYKPSLLIEYSVSRGPDALAGILVRGLVQGGMFGTGMLIEKRDARSIRFRRPGGLWGAIPDGGEIGLVTEGGGTLVQLQLQARGLGVRAAAIGLLFGAVAMALGLASGSVSVALGCGGLTWVLVGLTAWRAGHAHLRRTIATYISNTRYLKTG